VFAHGANAYLFTADSGTSDRGRKIPLTTGTDVDIGLDRLDVSSSTSTSAGSGAVKGTVKYWISDMSGTTEGPLSDQFGEIDAADGSTITVGNGNTLPDDGNDRRLYRSFANGDQPFYLATVATGTTVYTDNTADVDLGDLPIARRPATRLRH
jgi:hypothetical protein